MSKTIKQIADELGVSKQAIQKRLSREPLLSSVAPYISTVSGTKYIAVDGENLIKSAFNKNGIDTTSIDMSIDNNNTSIDKSIPVSIPKSIDKNEPSIHESIDKRGVSIDENKPYTPESIDKSDLEKNVNELETLKAKIGELETKLSEMKIQIADLKADKDKLNERLDKADNDRTELIQANKELTIALKAAQALHGMDKQQKVIETESDETNTQPQPEPQAKIGFFKRLFGKRS